MAFVVILHRSPNHESTLSSLLQRVTKMKVLQINQSTLLEPDHIYVIAPNSQLIVNDGYLEAQPVQRRSGHQEAIDIFSHAGRKPLAPLIEQNPSSEA